MDGWISTYLHISLFQFPVIKELGEAAFNFVFEGSELLAKVTEGWDPETCECSAHITVITRSP